MKFLFSRRGVVVVCLLLVALFVIRPQAGHLRAKISESISLATGKRVEIGSVHLRFIPRPGFDLEDFNVYDDPVFGAEPLLRSPEVTASLRVTSLLRGRVEISSLSLDDASVNLTRNSDGGWNLQALLERNRAITAAPTASRETRPEFPYVEASRARINFKLNSEKTHFALTDAEFSFWQDSENTWGMRLKARPIRTDANLTDTGQINVDGRWQRASSLAETPLQFAFEWKQAQIGQASKLIYGADKGWRGDTVVSGTVAGTPGRLQVTSDAEVDNFGRTDILNRGELQLVAHCGALYDALHQVLSNVDCNAPVGNGLLELKGNAEGAWLSTYKLSLLAVNVPAQNLLSLAKHIRKNVKNDLDAKGQIEAKVEVNRNEKSPSPGLKVEGEVQDLTLTYGGNGGTAVSVGTVPFGMVNKAKQAHVAAPETPTLQLGPVNIAMGRPAPVEASALLTRTGYQVSARGDAGIKRLLQAAHTLGIPAPAVAAEGAATIDLALSGNWANGELSRPVGSAQLHSVTAQVRGLNAPIQITNANLVLGEESLRLQNLKASAAGTIWRGSMEIPRPCSAENECRFQFNLHAGELNAATFNNLVNPRARKQSWYKIFARSGKPSYLLQARATGKIAADNLQLGRVKYDHFAANVDLDSGRLALSKVSGNILGGAATGDFKADFQAKPPVYSGKGSLETVSLGEVADLMHDGWLAGEGNTTYEFKASGWALQDVIESASVNAKFLIGDGNFPHIVLTTARGPLRVSDFSGELALRDGKFSLSDARLSSAGGVYKVSGTASLTGALDLKMSTESAAGYNITGTLINPRVSRTLTPATQAALKP